MSAPVTDRPRVARQRPVRGGTGPSVPTQRQPSRQGTGLAKRKGTTRKSGAGKSVAGKSVAGKSVAGKSGARGSAAQRAYAKRAHRLGQVHERTARRPRRRTWLGGGRLTFVLMVMALLAVGLVATLWLSTAATADSYRLNAARDEAGSLSEQNERLRAEVAAMQAAPTLAKAAGDMGMVPTRDVARLVVAPDGTVTVVGVPRAVAAPPPPPPATPTPATPSPAPATPAPGTPAPVTPAGGR
jgi:hypothetical protein